MSYGAVVRFNGKNRNKNMLSTCTDSAFYRMKRMKKSTSDDTAKMFPRLVSDKVIGISSTELSRSLDDAVLETVHS